MSKKKKFKFKIVDSTVIQENKQIKGYKIRILKEQRGNPPPRRGGILGPGAEPWPPEVRKRLQPRQPEAPSEPTVTPPPREEVPIEEPLVITPQPGTVPTDEPTTDEPTTNNVELRRGSDPAVRSGRTRIELDASSTDPQLHNLTTDPIPGIRFAYAGTRRANREYGTQAARDFLVDIGRRFGSRGDPFMVQDISPRGSDSTFRPHKSHQTGIDIDLSIPLLTGRQSTSNRGAGSRFRTPGVDEDVDYKRFLALARYTVSRSKWMFLDQSYIDGIKAEAQKLVDANQMTSGEFNTLFLKLRHAAHHKNHMHIRVDSPGYKDRNRNGRLDHLEEP
jgi:hypothetical protein